MTDTRTGERLPTFTVQLDAPAVGDPAVANPLAAESAERHGRDYLEGEIDLHAAAERIKGPSTVAPAGADETYPESAVPAANAAGGASAARTATGPQVPRRTHGGRQRKQGHWGTPRGGGSTDGRGSDEGEAPAA